MSVGRPFAEGGPTFPSSLGGMNFYSSGKGNGQPKSLSDRSIGGAMGAGMGHTSGMNMNPGGSIAGGGLNGMKPSGGMSSRQMQGGASSWNPGDSIGRFLTNSWQEDAALPMQESPHKSQAGYTGMQAGGSNRMGMSYGSKNDTMPSYYDTHVEPLLGRGSGTRPPMDNRHTPFSSLSRGHPSSGGASINVMNPMNAMNSMPPATIEPHIVPPAVPPPPSPPKRMPDTSESIPPRRRPQQQQQQQQQPPPQRQSATFSYEDPHDGSAIVFKALPRGGAYYSVNDISRPVFNSAFFGKDQMGFYIE
eukprot:gene16282-24951_t